MKIMLVCAGGLSTSILTKRIEKYAIDYEEDIQVKAFGVSEYLDYIDTYDVVLLGPQISYKIDEITASTSKPVTLIKGMDYAIGNAVSIIALARKLIFEQSEGK